MSEIHFMSILKNGDERITKSSLLNHINAFILFELSTNKNIVGHNTVDIFISRSNNDVGSKIKIATFTKNESQSINNSVLLIKSEEGELNGELLARIKEHIRVREHDENALFNKTIEFSQDFRFLSR